MLAYSTLAPFFQNLSILLRDRYGYSLVESGRIMALPSIVTCVTFPFIGVASDKLNKRVPTLVAALIILAASQLYIVMLPADASVANVLAALVINQLGYATFITNVWPGLNNLLKACHPEEKISDDEDNDDMSRSNFGIAIVCSMINAGAGFFPLLIGLILDRHEKVTDGNQSYGDGIIKCNVMLCLVDAATAVVLVIWLHFQPDKIDGKVSAEKSNDA
jgi:MFS family permease